MTSNCSQCGFQNPPEMRFCGNCGARLYENPAAGPASDITGNILWREGPDSRAGVGLLERFRQAGLEAAGQRRNVTVLFVDLSGYTQLSQQIDPEDLYDLIRQLARLLADDVYKYEGIVDKFTGDGLMALFGAPISTENNAELAVRAALEMQDSAARFTQQMHDKLDEPLRVHIGLNAGSVIVGGIGSDLLMNYTAIGDTVNLAQRLEEAAPPGCILASESVYQLTKALFDYEPPASLQLKGIREPVKGYQVRKAKIQPGRVRGIAGLHAPMIGRDSELGALRQAADELEKGNGRFVLLTGEAGIGKSRLISELKESLSRRPMTIVEGQSLTYRRSVAYWIFLDAIRNYLKLNLSSPESELSQQLHLKVSSLLEQRASEVIPYLEHLLSLRPSDKSTGERISYLEAGQLRKQIFLAVRELLTSDTHRQPLILILEDLHWADETSLELLHFLLEAVRQAPLMIVAVSRPFTDGKLSEIAEWANHYLHDRTVSINLQGLSQAQSEELLYKLIQIPELGPALRDHILQRAFGIPFYLEEILRMLIDRGILQREDDYWRVVPGAEIGALDVPDTLEGLILTRVDRLEEVQRRVLQVASVIGRQFSADVLQEVLAPLSKAQVSDSLAYLAEREFILPQVDQNHLEYAFRHTLMSDAIYKTTLRKERKELHGRIGEAIEKLYAGHLEGQVEILARHYSWSTHSDKALHYLNLAGQRAARNYAMEQARQYFEQALELLPEAGHTPEQAAAVFSGLGDVLAFTGEYAAARERYQAAAQHLGEPPTNSERLSSTLQRKIGSTYERQGDYDQAITCLNEAQNLLDQSVEDYPEERAQILNDKGWIYFRRGKLEEAEVQLVQGLSLVESSTCYDVIASIYNRLGGVYYKKNNIDLASTYVRKSLILREEMGDTVAVARSYNNLGLLAWEKSNLNQALENFQRSIELNATLGDIEAIILLHSNIGLIQTDRGEMAEARLHLEESRQAALQIGHSYMEGTAYLNLARYWLAAGEWAQSLEYGNRALAIYEEIGARENLDNLYLMIGEAWLGLGDLEKAGRACTDAFDCLREHNRDHEVPSLELGRAHRLRGKIARAKGDFELAAQELKRSADLFAVLDNPLEAGRTSLARAFLAQSKNDKMGARVHAGEARFIFTQFNALGDLQAVEKFLSQ